MPAPEDMNFVETEIHAALKGLSEYAPEFRIIRPDGSIRYIQAASQTFRDSDGKPQRMIGTNIDVTVRRQLEIEREKASKLESIGLLAGGIAHDFNNLLMAILGNVALCKMNASIKGADDLVDSMVEAENALKRAKELTRQLLTFAKGGAPIKKAVHMPKLIDEALRFAATGSKVKCSSKYQDNLWPCDIDEGQISQVLHNLVINAVQAMPEGGKIETFAENFEVESKSETPLNDGRYVKIVIRDQGHGIPKDHLKKIFDPYFTTNRKEAALALQQAIR